MDGCYALYRRAYGLWGAILALSLMLPVAAQDITLTTMPQGVVNNPELDLYGLKRPALSVMGFDNTEAGYDPAYGLGLKQVLERRFGQQDPLIVPVFDRLMEIARTEQLSFDGIEDPTARRQRLDRNTTILQSRAFEALATFVLELNDVAIPELRSHAEAMAALRQALLAPPGDVFLSGENVVDDPVRYGRAIGNVARALDLYLALENAYSQFPEQADLSLLLAPEVRIARMTELARVLQGVDAILRTRAIDLYADELDYPDEVKDLLRSLFDYIPAGDRPVEEVEAGNWAMKQRVAVGYGALAVQVVPGTEDKLELDRGLLAALRDEALRSLMVTSEADTSRNRHWNFMTSGGRRFWAEGPYYLDFALEQVLPFWHAVRANDTDGELADPFHSAWFTNALAWHADLVTPDGRIAPLDDGNKAPVRYTGLLRWTGGYGDEAIGQRYAWIEEALGGPARRDETLLLELAIPRTATTQAPSAQVGNPPGRLTRHASEQQLVLRRTPDGQTTHYVLLNGEHGNAVDRGEGHEQPDQLQLLYYKGATSYLLDSGYDRGFTVENSSWNHYYDHNVMVVGDGEGGLRPPVLRLFQVRKASEPWFMGEVDALHMEEGEHEAVTVLHGAQTLAIEPERPYHADYTRDVLFIDGAGPYLIDLNRIQQRINPTECASNAFKMQYHANSNDIAVPEEYAPARDGFVRWNRIGGEEDKTLDAFPMAVEAELTAAAVHVEPDSALEAEVLGEKQFVNLQRLTLYDAARCEPYWTVATLLRIGSADDEASDASPVLIWPYGDGMTEQQGWVWDRGSDVYDVFVARSVEAPADAVVFSPQDADPSFPPLQLTLPEEAPFGFVRIAAVDGTWQADAAYRVGLEVEDGQAPAGIGDAGGELATGYALSAAYPNPFNPTTRFTLRLREPQQVTLVVYDMLGRRVATLHDGLLPAGVAQAFTVDADGWPSGLYVVHVRGEQFTATRRVTLVK